jgi:hypothetical protein
VLNSTSSGSWSWVKTRLLTRLSWCGETRARLVVAAATCAECRGTETLCYVETEPNVRNRLSTLIDKRFSNYLRGTKVEEAFIESQAESAAVQPQSMSK